MKVLITLFLAFNLLTSCKTDRLEFAGSEANAMSVSTNKNLIQYFFDALNANDYDRAFEMVADDAIWWVPGTLPFSGEKSKVQYRAIASGIQANFPDGFHLTISSMIEEGDILAAEVVSNGTHRNGRAYNNKYHFRFQIRDGRLFRVKEYMDTQHLAQLIAP